jgi:hypothetical protein
VDIKHTVKDQIRTRRRKRSAGFAFKGVRLIYGPQVLFDASEIDQLGRAFKNLPGQIKTKAMARAMRRMRDAVRTQVVRLNANRVDIPVGKVRERTTAHFNAGGNTIEVIEKSGWIALYELGARQTRVGVTVKLRGSYRHAFIAGFKSGHVGVLRRRPGTHMRSKPTKEQLIELFGPNPAHDITKNPDDYLRLVLDLLDTQLMPRVMHEILNLLPR